MLRCCPLRATRRRFLQTYSNEWYRDYDIIIANVIGASLLAISIFPIGYVHSKFLFNQFYAAALYAISRRRELVIYINSSLNLRGLIALIKSTALGFINVLGWILALFGLRQTVTDLLRRTPFWPHSNREVGYEVMTDTQSGRFVPTEEFGDRPAVMTSDGPSSEAFRAKVRGPINEITEMLSSDATTNQGVEDGEQASEREASARAKPASSSDVTPAVDNGLAKPPSPRLNFAGPTSPRSPRSFAMPSLEETSSFREASFRESSIGRGSQIQAFPTVADRDSAIKASEAEPSAAEAAPAMAPSEAATSEITAPEATAPDATTPEAVSEAAASAAAGLFFPGPMTPATQTAGDLGRWIDVTVGGKSPLKEAAAPSTPATSIQPSSSSQPASSSKPFSSSPSSSRPAAPPGRSLLSKQPTKPTGLSIETASSMNLLNLAGWQPAELGVSREPTHFDDAIASSQPSPPRVVFADKGRKGNPTEDPPPPPPPKLTLPQGWNVAVAPATGMRYYYNTETNETSWERP